MLLVGTISLNWLSLWLMQYAAGCAHSRFITPDDLLIENPWYSLLLRLYSSLECPILILIKICTSVNTMPVAVITLMGG